MTAGAAAKGARDAVMRFVWRLRRPSKAENLRLLRERGEDLASFTIREARVEDIPALAALHARTWSETYWNVKHPPTAELREHQWREQFQVTDGSWFCFVVENRRGELIGFAKGKRHAGRDEAGSGELNKIYLLREYQRLGLGRRMMGHVVRRFRDMGISSIMLFGVPENPSCHFHEALGGERLLNDKGGFDGGYIWHDLARLAALCPTKPDGGFGDECEG
jgi:ribosomal protein S18 acetylase RimI-like enzyme